ncbi:MAG TPA: GspH/FimT family pseudopilin [Noviherbaspirillum sp.]|nr:GspH/FimT family pseudopilin [Noviherbaspirillum sp.]
MLQRGFSLIELMTVVAVAVIVLGIGVPGMRGLVVSQQLTGAANALHASIKLARSEAISRGARVEIAPAAPGVWAAGWVVYIDQDGNGSYGAGDQLLYSHGPLRAGFMVTTTFAQNSIPYTGTGRALAAGTLKLSAHGQGRNITVNLLGRTRICRPAEVGKDC